MRIHVAGHIGGFKNTIRGRLHLGLCYLKAQVLGETADHNGWCPAQLLKVDPDRRRAGQRLVARSDETRGRLSPLLLVR